MDGNQLGRRETFKQDRKTSVVAAAVESPYTEWMDKWVEGGHRGLWVIDPVTCRDQRQAWPVPWHDRTVLPLPSLFTHTVDTFHPAGINWNKRRVTTCQRHKLKGRKTEKSFSFRCTHILNHAPWGKAVCVFEACCSLFKTWSCQWGQICSNMSSVNKTSILKKNTRFF